MSWIISLKLTCHFPFSTPRFREFCPFSLSRRNGGFTVMSSFPKKKKKKKKKKKNAVWNCCFILMHCYCQIMYVHVAPWNPFNLGKYLTEPLQMVWQLSQTCGCAVSRLSFFGLNFYYFRVWCLQSLCHLKRKLFASRDVYRLSSLARILKLPVIFERVPIENCLKWSKMG